MMEMTRGIDLIIAASGFILSVMGLVQVLISVYMEKTTKNFFIMIFCVLIAYLSCILLRELTYSNTGAGWAAFSRVIFFGQAFFSSSLTVLITALLLHQSGGAAWRKSWFFRIAVTLWIIYIAILICAQFTTEFYSVDHNNIYARGPYFPLLMVTPVLIMLLNMVALWQRRVNLPAKQKIAFLVYAIVPMAAMLLQARLFGIHLIALSTVISAMIMFTCIMTDQMEQYRIREEENAQLKIDILLAQIQPHFLFNSLTTIKYLCRRDPEKAEEAVTKFTEYLRHNMDSLSMEKPIAFEDELNHVKGFLDLQKIRFGEKLKVEYDLEYMNFRIPTLTLLPLVENAVSYGVVKSGKPQGTVTIRTRSFPDQIEVMVADDGPGFVREVMPDDRERSHIGIQNVRQRLRGISGGELKIDSEIGTGTTATIVLPKEKKDEQE